MNARPFAQPSPPRRGPHAAALAALLLVLLPQAAPPPTDLSQEAWQVLGVALAMALLWVTEALPLAATALVPLAILPLSGTLDIRTLAPAYAHPLIILFLGGFLIARAIEAHGLHRRLALALLALFGSRPASVVAGLMLAAAFLSLWISNTATAMIMAPIGAAIAASRAEDEALGASIMLGIAFAATIGGMGSLIGTPPNAIFGAYLSETHRVEIGFAEWMLIGLPTTAILLPVAWGLLTRIAFRPEPAPLAPPDEAPPPMGPGERRVLLVAAAAAIAWITRPLLAGLLPSIDLTDAGIAMAAALALFALPDGRGGRLLDWEGAKNLRWDVLILFGGGLALAQAIDSTGLAVWIANSVSSLDNPSPILAIAVFASVIVIVGELASNTAMAAIFLPVAGATAAGLGIDPAVFAAPVALAASIGFMLPVATPPNAIVFTHPAVTRMRMLKAGAPLDVIGTAIAVGLASLLAPLVLGG